MFIFSLCFLVSSCKKKDSTESNMSAQETTTLSSNYTGEYAKDNGGVGIEIISNNQMKFWINTVVDTNPCNIGEDGGVVTNFDKNHAKFTGDNDCVVEFNFENNKVKISTKNCDGYCGMNAVGSMDGEYVKKSDKVSF
jgi:hypothetical protein